MIDKGRNSEMLDRILNKIVSQYKPEKIILFGSYAKGLTDSDSDIDLLIIKNTSERFIDRWTAIQKIILGTHESVPVDTLVMSPQEISKRLSIGDQFIEDIINNGRVLYAA